jgi:hypothetical protein
VELENRASVVFPSSASLVPQRHHPVHTRPPSTSKIVIGFKDHE